MLDKYENLLWSGLQWHRSWHSNEMTSLPILLAAVFFGTTAVLRIPKLFDIRFSYKHCYFSHVCLLVSGVENRDKIYNELNWIEVITVAQPLSGGHANKQNPKAAFVLQSNLSQRPPSGHPRDTGGRSEVGV